VARVSPSVFVNLAGALQAACLSGTTIDAIAELLLGGADLG
jgi:hypothetical protein